MTISVAERRQIENEMIFRRSNEQVSDELQELGSQLIKDDYRELIIDDDILLQFLCECSDENCDMRIPMKLSVYQEIHKNREAFIIKPKHQVQQIEAVIYMDDNYSVVEKNKTVAEPGDELNRTPITNI